MECQRSLGCHRISVEKCSKCSNDVKNTEPFHPYYMILTLVRRQPYMMLPVSAVRGAGDGSGGGGVVKKGVVVGEGGHRRRLNLHKETFIDVLRF